ncbi:MAG: hypothetical protein KBT02_08560 [Treponema sp.]|nr:hypothetical protein [Candidatus Treponema caballi]
MGDDNKVTNGMMPEVRLFLQNTFFKSYKEQAETYDLEHEYAKASKNKDYRTAIIIGILFVIAIATTIGISKYIDYRNRQISVNVDVFEDVNLKKLLDMVSRTQSDLENAISEKSRNEQDRQNELEAARARNEVDKLALQSLNLASVQLQERMDELDEEYDKQITEINSRYESLLLDIDTRIGEYQNQLAAYDSNSVETAQKQQAAIDSQRQVFELEKQALVEKYEAALSELRNKIIQLQEQDIQNQKDYVKQTNQSSQYQRSLYDPIIIDERGDAILASLSGTWYESFSIENADPDGDMYPVLEEVASKMSDLEYAVSILLNLPQINSMPEYVKAVKELASEIGIQLVTEAERIMADLNTENDELKLRIDQKVSEIELQNEKIMALTKTIETNGDAISGITEALAYERYENRILEQYMAYFDSLAFEQGVDGVVAACSGDSYLMYISPVYAGEAAGHTAYVYRGASEYIGEVTLTDNGGFIYAVPVSTAAGKTIRESDTIILNLTGGRK